MNIKNLKFTSFIFMSFAVYFASPSIYSKKTVVTVFVHGTIAPGAALFSPRGLINKKLDANSTYGKIAEKVRKDKKMQHDWPILEEGMIEITPSQLRDYHNKTLDPKTAKYGAYQLTGAYDYFFTKLHPEMVRRYFFYGHNGLLEEGERIQSGISLCNELAKIAGKYKQKKDVVFHLVGHSHGATISLYTALGDQKNKDKITIEKLILLGMPLQKEQDKLIADPMFQEIYNFYSKGDAIQTREYISTKGRRSFAQMNEVVTKASNYPHRYDVCLNVANQSDALSHKNLWLLKNYESSLTFKFGKKAKHLKEIFNLLDPLPIAAYAPCLIECISQHFSNSTSKNIIRTTELNITKDGSKIRLAPSNSNRSHAILKEDLDYITERAKVLWEPYACCGELIKHKLILKSTWNTLLGR